jgi:hypothetical protein
MPYVWVLAQNCVRITRTAGYHGYTTLRKGCKGKNLKKNLKFLERSLHRIA